MDINLGVVVFQISPTQILALFWGVMVTLSFNGTYFLSLWDHKEGAVTRSRIMITVVIGTLVVLGTYADTLAAKPFALKDCLLLAFVAGHGWTAEDLVQNFLKEVRAGAAPTAQSPLPSRS